MVEFRRVTFGYPYAVAGLLFLGACAEKACPEKSVRDEQSEAYDRAFVEVHTARPVTQQALERAMGRPPAMCAEAGCEWVFLTRDGVKKVQSMRAGDAILLVAFQTEKVDIYPMLDGGKL